MRNITICLILLCVQMAANAQVNQSWAVRYHDTTTGSSSSANSIAVDAAGNVYVTGKAGITAALSNIVTVKYNSSGTPQWAKILDLGAEDVGIAIAVDASGNVYVAGNSSTGLHFAYTTVKYNSAGVQQWVQSYTYNINDDDKTVAIAVDASGNVYITGSSYGTVGTVMDYATIKYSPSGSQLWVQRYNGPATGNDYPTGLVLDASANVYVTGYSPGSGLLTDFATIKYNSDGVQQWVSRYNGTVNNYDVAYALAVDAAMNVYVTGTSMQSAVYGSQDYATVKYNSAGVQQWASTYNGTGSLNDEAYSIALDGSGNVFITGMSVGVGSVQDYATVKYNSAGVQQWVQRYDNPAASNADIAYKIAVDGASNSYVTGYSLGGNVLAGVTTIKYNSAGVQQWLQRYNGPAGGSDYGYSIALDTTGGVYVTGRSNNGTTYDFITIKYSQPIGIQQISSEIPKEFSLSQNYPNPFNPTSKIKFQIAKSGNTSLVIFDGIGREVSTLVNEQLQPGTYEVDFDGTKLASGIYFYKLITENFTETKKMILAK